MSQFTYESFVVFDWKRNKPGEFDQKRLNSPTVQCQIQYFFK